MEAIAQRPCFIWTVLSVRKSDCVSHGKICHIRCRIYHTCSLANATATRSIDSGTAQCSGVICWLIDWLVNDRFYITLFSVLELSRCAFVACDSKWVTAAFYSRTFWIATKVVYIQRCLVVTWVVPREIAAAVNHAPCHVTSLHAAKPHRKDACVFCYYTD